MKQHLSKKYIKPEAKFLYYKISQIHLTYLEYVDPLLIVTSMFLQNVSEKGIQLMYCNQVLSVSGTAQNMMMRNKNMNKERIPKTSTTCTRVMPFFLMSVSFITTNEMNIPKIKPNMCDQLSIQGKTPRKKRKNRMALYAPKLYQR